MRIKETPLGKGLSRLEVESMCSCERNLPTHVVDEIIRDIIGRKRCGCVEHRCENTWNRPRFTEPCCTSVPRFTRPCVAPQCPNREPDGIDVHVDRPLHHNFRTHHDWSLAMAKYRTLEDAAKDCDWECREPMKGVAERPWVKTCLHTEPLHTRVVIEDEDEWEDGDWFCGNKYRW